MSRTCSTAGCIFIPIVFLLDGDCYCGKCIEDSCNNPSHPIDLDERRKQFEHEYTLRKAGEIANAKNTKIAKRKEFE